MDIQYKKYGSYKDSGVEWLGEIPEHWKVEKGKWLFKKEQRPIKEDYEIITCFRDGEVTLRSNRRTEGFTNAIKEHGYQGIHKGDLVIHAMDAFAGAIGVSDSEGKSTPVYSVCTPRFEDTVNPYYYAYLLRSLALNGLIVSLAKGIRERSTDFRFNDFGDLEYYLPPLSEQTAIANFLDEKCEKIDKAIAQKEKLIELLKERKQILIQNTVIKGLNPNVKMKDSGVDWIGEIPDHWKIGKAKYYSQIFVPERSKPNFNEDAEGVPWFTTEHLRKDYLESNKATFYVSEKDARKVGSRTISPKSVLATCVGEFGISSINNCECIINQQIQGYTNLKIIPQYLKSFVELSHDYYKINATMTTIPYVNRSTFADLPLVVPSNDEQNEIIKFTNLISNSIATSIVSNTVQIKKLKEYKSTLIDSAVTGKIKVV